MGTTLHGPFIPWVFMLVKAVLGITAMLVVSTALRRLQREWYFRRLDRLRGAYEPVVAATLSGKIDYEQGLASLRPIGGYDRTHVLERVLVSRPPSPAEIPILRQLCQDLGLIRIWQQRLGGQREHFSWREFLARPEGLVERLGGLGFLGRAASAEYLGMVEDQASWPYLVAALDDPHPDVQTVAARALGAIREPRSFARLVEQLHKVILGPSNRLSFRTIRGSLASFPLGQAAELLPLLEHLHPRIRFAATEVIREMVERQAASDPDFTLSQEIFSFRLGEIFLNQLAEDTNPDVRARTAAVIARLPEAPYPGARQPAGALAALADDPQWFVRMHALRAMARPRYAIQAGLVRRQLSDEHWRVRKEAARTLRCQGKDGINELLDHLLETEDCYSREQVAEELQQDGYIQDLLDHYPEGVGPRERQVIEQLVRLGRARHLIPAPQQGNPLVNHHALLRDFGQHPDPRVRAWVNQVTAGR